MMGHLNKHYWNTVQFISQEMREQLTFHRVAQRGLVFIIGNTQGVCFSPFGIRVSIPRVTFIRIGLPRNYT